MPPRWLRPVLEAFGSATALLAMGLAVPGAAAGEFTTFYGHFFLTMMVAQYSLSDLRIALFSHVERLPMAFFDRTPVGSLVSRMTTDIDAINEMFSAGSLTLFMDRLTLLGIVAIMFTLTPRLAIWSMLRDSPAGHCYQLLRVRSRNVYREIRERLAVLNAYLSEALAGMPVIQLFTRERDSRERVRRAQYAPIATPRCSANVYDAAQFSSVEAISSCTVAIILWIGGGETIHRHGHAGNPGRLHALRADVLHALARHVLASSPPFNQLWRRLSALKR